LKRTFSDTLRIVFRGVLEPVSTVLNRTGVTPITVTLLGVAGNILAAVLVAGGQVSLGGLVMLIAWPIDALDGTMARLRGEASDWGAFVDAVSDRYSELFVLGGLLYHFATLDEHVLGIVTFAAAAGSVMVSYVKARAEAQSFSAREGVLTRAERYLVLGPTLLFNVPGVGVWIVAVLANVTALQRVIAVRSQAHAAAKRLVPEEGR
jgi:CDP-diacylglycerol--glycerol-3-phosphate 3-phosphatidyltransferase